MKNGIGRTLLALMICMSFSVESWADSQPYPSKPVKVIVPYPAGGGMDTMARIVGQKLSQAYGVQFYVENLPGAGGTIGTGAAANAPADGLTILFVNPDFVVQPIVKAKAPYDPFKNFVPISLAAISREMIAVHPSVPARNVKELVALLKANPGKYNYATPGPGTSPHLACERLFKLTHGLDVVHVPFKGGAPAVMSTVAGHTSILHMSVPNLAPHVKEGTLRAIAIASDRRASVFPDVPTLAESGVPAHEVEYMIGVVAPSGTPKEIVESLQQKIAAIVAQLDVKERFAALGFEPVGSTSAEFGARLRHEHATWSKVVRDANISLD